MSYELSEFVITKPFDVDSLCQQHKQAMIETFIENKINKKEGGGYNTLYDNREFTEEIRDKFLKVVHDTFDVGYSQSKIQTWIYCQNDKHSNNLWHTHVNTSSVNAVFYIDPPDVGGGLQIEYCGVITTIPVKTNTLYLFPYWMAHRPVAQVSPHWRISVNVEYKCRERPVVRQTRQIW